MENKELIEKFKQYFGEGEVRLFYAPGRVNLIGEHIDYNGGHVFPCALNMGTFACVRKRKDKTINLISLNYPLRASVHLEGISYDKKDEWTNYPKGVIKCMLDKGYEVGGMDILISGNIPSGAGLSSSASLEILISYVISMLFNDGNIDKLDLITISQEAENNFVGVNCGVMDQFAVCMAERNKAILLNCNSLEYKYADINLGKYQLIIMNTNKKRKLYESKYNERRRECDLALKYLSKIKNIKSLCDLTVNEFQDIKQLIPDKTLVKRAQHAVEEDERVKLAYNALSQGNINKFAKLITASHNSLRTLYEVTGKELDILVEASLSLKSCIGARMTGAGFGGCAIALVNGESVSEFKEFVSKYYFEHIGYTIDFYESSIGEGVKEIIN